MRKSNLKLIVLNSAKELGEKTNLYLKHIFKTKNDFLILINHNRFANGEAKVCLEENVRDADLYILADVGNYSLNYQLHGITHYMGPDEHFQDIKRVILASSGHADHITVIMPFLYQSRQHKRKGQESLDCANALQELERLGVNEIITFDAHDPSVCNAIPNLPFENIYPTNIILKKLLEEESSFLDEFLVVSPDMGAIERARYYAEMLHCDVGVFYKRRDLSKIINGKNPIVEHVYMGASVKHKTVLIVDDMIASGQSMLEVAKLIKQKGAEKVYLIATFTLLTEGPDTFHESYQQGIFQKLFSTNLSYVPEDIKQQIWYEEVDCAEYLAQTIYDLSSFSSIKRDEDMNKEIFERIKSAKR